MLGKTASFDRPVPGKPVRAYFKYEFRHDGVMVHSCHVVRPNNTTGPCQRPDGKTRWFVQGDQLCFGGGERESCVVVSGSGESYVFRKVKGENPWVDGDVTLR